MQLRVTVPAGVKGGEVVRVRVSQTNSQLSVRIPKGLQPGQSFVVSVPENTNDEDVEVVPHVKHPYTELGVALCVGVLIGCSIVFGFVLGILYVTDPKGVSSVATKAAKIALKNEEL